MKEDSRKMLITPQMAKLWLEKNTHNRKISTQLVEKYARDVKAGEWKITNQGIGFDSNGALTDGQHRLLACVRADVPFESFVTFGLDPKSQMVVDGGRLRSVGEQLFLGHKMDNATIKVAMANIIAATLKGVNAVSLSADIAWKVIDLYSDEMEFILSNRGAAPRGLSYAPALSGLVMAAKVDLDKAVEFKEKYFLGTDLKADSPILTFRNFMLNRGNGAGSSVSGYRKTIMIFSMLAAMNYFLGKPLKRQSTSLAGYQYFMSRQRTCSEMVLDWMNV